MGGWVRWLVAAPPWCTIPWFGGWGEGEGRWVAPAPPWQGGGGYSWWCSRSEAWSLLPPPLSPPPPTPEWEEEPGLPPSCPPVSWPDSPGGGRRHEAPVLLLLRPTFSRSQLFFLPLTTPLIFLYPNLPGLMYLSCCLCTGYYLYCPAWLCVRPEANLAREWARPLGTASVYLALVYPPFTLNSLRWGRTLCVYGMYSTLEILFCYRAWEINLPIISCTIFTFIEVTNSNVLIFLFTKTFCSNIFKGAET